MSDLSVPALLGAVGLGVVHGLTPCAHSWPVLVPIVGRTGSVARPAAWYGLGVVLAGALFGVAMGGGGKFLGGFFDGPVGRRVEEGFGVLMIVVGVAIALRTRIAHAGHVHGACAPADDSGAEAACAHAEHHPTRFARFGRSFGLFMLGFASITVPCWSNATAAAISVGNGDVVGGALAYGAYAAAAAVTTYVVLRLVRNGAAALKRLSSPAFEGRLLLVSGVALALWGVATVLHIGHDHSHGHGHG
jgi:nickel/cobalt exporter